MIFMKPTRRNEKSLGRFGHASRPLKLMKAIHTQLATAVFLIFTLTACITIPDAGRKKSRTIPVSYYLYDEVEVDATAEDAFNFLINHIPDVYTDMAEGHLSYEVIGGAPLAIGKRVNCHEKEGPQEIFNHYIVDDIIPGRLVYLVSDGSRALYHKPNGEVVENESNTHVYWDFYPLGAQQTKISLTIVIGLPNRTIKFLLSLLGSKKLWRDHLREELVNMGRFMEQH